MSTTKIGPKTMQIFGIPNPNSKVEVVYNFFHKNSNKIIIK
jgi:hypothetical protein